MIQKALVVKNLGTEITEHFFKAFRRGDAAEGSDLGLSKYIQRQALACIDRLEILRLVRAFDYLSLRIILANQLEEGFITIAIRFSQKNIAGT